MWSQVSKNSLLSFDKHLTETDFLLLLFLFLKHFLQSNNKYQTRKLKDDVLDKEHGVSYQ